MENPKDDERTTTVCKSQHIKLKIEQNDTQKTGISSDPEGYMEVHPTPQLTFLMFLIKI